jgi:NAD(P)-dependent dehydrogenase (short-subunit alcohol dehydrogenase family)
MAYQEYPADREGAFAVQAASFSALSLAEQVILVAGGGGGGIGEYSAKLLAARGAAIVAVDRDGDEADRVSEEIRQSGGQAIGVRADVGQEAEVAAAVDSAVAAFGYLSGAFNNVGGTFGITGPLTDLAVEDWDRVHTVNLRAIFLLLKHEIPRIAGHGGGAIVNTCSIQGTVATPGVGAYVAAKHGVLGLTKAVAVESAALAVRVNAVLPGTIETPARKRVFENAPDVADRMASGQLLGRCGSTQEVAELVAFLMSDAAGFCTGAGYLVDGGYTAV